MKIAKKIKKVRSVTLRISEKTMEKFDDLAVQHGTSRQHLIERVLETAISSKDFVVEISTIEGI